MKLVNILLLNAAVFGLVATGAAASECKSVKGRVVSEIVTQFSNGDPCPEMSVLCTEGRFTGGLKGRFRFFASTLTPFGMLDAMAPMDVAATTGVISIDTRFCDGTLVLDDTSAFSLSLDGFVGSIQTPNGSMSSGGCNGATGRLRLEGVFMGGCVDCRYKGEICGVGPVGDDDDGEDD